MSTQNTSCTVDLGVFEHCPDITLPIKVRQNGAHIIIYNIRGSIGRFQFTGTAGQLMTFQNFFNEQSLFTIQILQPDGTLYKYSEIERFFDCIFPGCLSTNDTFQIETKISFDWTATP